MIRVGTVFSGIGSIEQALKRGNIPHKVIFACDNGDIELNLFDKELQKEFKELQKKRSKRILTSKESQRLAKLSLEENILSEQIRTHIYGLSNKKEQIDYVKNLYLQNSKKHNFVKMTYEANYPDVEDYHLDIRFLDGRRYANKIDLFVGGSPCQAFSSVGAQRGLEDTRGTLFYEFARLIKEIRPKVFIYENVRGLLAHDSGRTWETIKRIFQKELLYDISEPKILNSADYGIPQTRRRLFVVGFRKDVKHKKFEYPDSLPLKYTMQDFLEDNCADGFFQYTKNGDIVIKKKKGKPNARFILSKAIRDYVLTSGTKSFKTSTKTDLPIARTLLRTMTQHHRAGVDNYITIGYELDGTRKLRALTDRECLRLMGYPDSFKIVVSPVQIYRQAGNSIVVDVMFAVLKNIIKTGVFK